MPEDGEYFGKHGNSFFCLRSSLFVDLLVLCHSEECLSSYG